MLACSDLQSAPEFLTNELRVANRELLTGRLAIETNRFYRDDLIAALERAGVPAGPINSVAEAFADEQIRFRKMEIEIDGVPGVRSPMKFADRGLVLERPAPRLGEHTQEVLRELGRT